MNQYEMEERIKELEKRNADLEQAFSELSEAIDERRYSAETAQDDLERVRSSLATRLGLD